jgi:hypothetical protein
MILADGAERPPSLRAIATRGGIGGIQAQELPISFKEVKE